MKSRKIGFLFLLGLLICLTSCGHTHNHAADLSKDDTNHWYECECGDKKDVTAHDYTIAGEVTKEPTCEEVGTQTYSCICGATTEKVVAAKNHSHSTELSKDAENHWYECECGDKKDVTAHDYTIAGEVTKEPTCEEAGTQTYSCVCGATTVKEVPATGHKYDNLETNWENYVTDVKSDSPTRYQIISHTSADGLYLKIEQYVNNVIIATDPSDWNTTHVEMELWNHCIGYGWDGTYFGFFADGSFYINNWNNCSGVYNCAEVIENPSGSTYAYTVSYNIFIAFPNNLDNPQDDSYAYAEIMFHTPEEDNSGFEHSAVKTKDGWRNLWKDQCNSYEIHSNGITRKDGEYHNYTIAGEVTKEATCEGTGTQVYSCICGATTEKEIPAKGHSLSTELSKDETSHWYACSNCDIKKDETAHDYTIAGEVTKEPTYDAVGTQVFSCICGATTEKEVPAKSHSFSTELSKDETTHWYACSDCDARKDEAAHNYTIEGEVTKEPTCEGTGTQVFSCICGATTEKEIPAKGHKYDNLETNWDNYVTEIKSDAQERYQVISHTSADGLYIKIEQYVNNVIIATDPSDWDTTHVEMELWNHCVGNGFGGTYFAFFADGTFYINNWNNCSGVYNCAEVIENPSGSTYAYTISYNIFIAFPNNLDNPQDDSYAYCQFLFHTPEEDNTGYENAKVIVKDGWRSLWTDNCNSYEIHSNGITRKDGAN